MMASSFLRPLACFLALMLIHTLSTAHRAHAQNPGFTVNFDNQLITSDLAQADCLAGQPAGTTAFTFDITLLADQPATRLGDTQVYVDYNTLGFGANIAAAGAVTASVGTFIDFNTGPPLNQDFYGPLVIADNTPSRLSIYTEWNFPTAPSAGSEVSSVTPDVLLQVCMVIADATQTSNLVFNDLTLSQLYQSTNAEVDRYEVVLGGGLDALLPVELVSFEVLADGSSVVLSWQTAAETNNAGFEVEHRRVGETTQGEWQSLSWSEGEGTTTQVQHYSHRVHELAAGRHVFRLKQVDYDGTFAYSPEVEVTIEMVESYALSSAYPNPFNPETSFELSVREQQEVTIEVYDVLGRMVAVLYRGGMQANASRVFRWEAGDHASGLYFIRVVGERFAETRQVTLVK